MALNQFMSDWNNSFELKITVGDVKKPTQSFLFAVFEFFLGVMHIDCDKLKRKMDERHYKIWVVNYFSDFFKVCYPKLKILYGDLLQPDSKKVLEILRFLLNYHLFVKALQTDVVDIATSKIEKYNQTLAKKNQLQLYQEEFRIQSERKELALADYVRLIAENKRILDGLYARSEVLDRDTAMTTEKLHCMKAEKIKLSCELEVLKQMVVSDDELDALMKEIRTADTLLLELNAVQENVQMKNQCLAQEFSERSVEVDELSTNINESCVLDSVEKCRDNLKNLADLKNKIKEFQNQIENAIAKRVELLEDIKSGEAALVNKRNELSSVYESCQTKSMELESKLKHDSIYYGNHVKKLETAEQQIEQLKLMQEQLVSMGLRVIEHIRNS